MKGVCLIKWNQYLQYVFAHTTRAIFGSPYFNQSLKFMGGFIVGTMAHILGPRKLTNWMP